MANGVLGFDDAVDRGTVTASSQVLSLPAINVQHPFLSPKVWRSVGNTESLTCDFTLDRFIDVVALLNCNFTASSTWRIRLDSDSGFAAPHTYDSGTIPTGIDLAYKACIHVLPSRVTARYLRVDLADTGSSFLQVGRWVAMRAWRMTRNFAWGTRERWHDLSRQSVAESGQIWVDRGPNYRVVSITNNAITDAETHSDLQHLGRTARARDVLFVSDPNSANMGRDSIFGLLEAPPEPRQEGLNRHSMALTIVERL